MSDAMISPEAQQAFKLDYANKSLLLLEAQAEMMRLRAQVERLQNEMSRVTSRSSTPPSTAPDPSRETAQEPPGDTTDELRPLRSAGERPR